ncbi:hypothetical protein MC885_013065 [Smutsia gigantea]|nr:hypothetical protein MC885_013065 [Smutsia gigantea]
MHIPRTPPTSKVIKTRYRIVKKTPAPPISGPPSPSLPSWRARRLSLSRSLVLNRVRPTTRGGKTQASSPQWQSRGYRCIGGVLYKVSANKLLKTYSRPTGDGGSRPLLRTGRLDPVSSCSRSLASRAVQRSLAIVRQARQRRPQQYCMYYNRFGRCNHGESCPYIHDPEKVAVCTRFVRGTCKKTDGTCPFSHHVSKEKPLSPTSPLQPLCGPPDRPGGMPVCSYFLKGICNNSDCPYSHVYVSRKAEVCTDFLKGYCPLGAQCRPGGAAPAGGPPALSPVGIADRATPMGRSPPQRHPFSPQCKKKHTLLCPDFSRGSTCPRGAQCQLLHRTQKHLGRRAAPAPEPCDVAPRSRAATGQGPRKSSAARHPATQTPSSPAATAAGSASPPSSPRVLTVASGSRSSSKAPSPSSPASPSPSMSLDQEELPLQEETASAVTGSSSLSKLPAFISLQSWPSPGGQPRAQTPRSSPTKDSEPGDPACAYLSPSSLERKEALPVIALEKGLLATKPLRGPRGWACLALSLP